MNRGAPSRAALSGPYRRTVYRVEAPAGAIDIRIGERHPALDALLDSHAARSWAFVSACNPGSARLAAPENDARHAALLEALRARGLSALEGLGIPHGEGWLPERSVLVPGVDKEEAIEIGRRFGQNAIVFGRRGGRAELLWIRGCRKAALTT
ncbi:MAG TPA: DUF3293 domain-containing protein [Burkholderiales bacterium]|nr:DUF3293 domain-containing protein [Burkholderiales bacterium]